MTFQNKVAVITGGAHGIGKCSYEDFQYALAVGLILAFAVPMFIGNVFQQAYNMMDTMIAGRFLGEEAIAAIGATAI